MGRFFEVIRLLFQRHVRCYEVVKYGTPSLLSTPDVTYSGWAVDRDGILCEQDGEV